MGIFERLFGSKRRPQPTDERPQGRWDRLEGDEARVADAARPAIRVAPRGVGPTPEAEIARIAPLVSKILSELGRSLRPGMPTKEIETRAVDLLREADLDPRMLHFRGFPAALAVSIDDEVIHGIPSADRVLEDGQLVKIQLGARTQQGTADQGWTFGVGTLSREKTLLSDAGVRALRAAIDRVREGARTGDLGAAMQSVLEGAGYTPIRDFVGYRIGAQPMMEPQLKGYGKPGTGVRLQREWNLHLHVIAAARAPEVTLADDGWTVITNDGAPGALFTAVVRVTAQGCDVLTPLLD